MATGLQLRQQTTVKQELRLTPELRTAIELLLLPHMELEQRIEQELEENPLLEWADNLPETAAPPEQGRVLGTDFARSTETPDFDPFERFIANEPSLYDHLEWQVGISRWPEADKTLALELIPRIAPTGLLPDSDGELAALTGTTGADVARVRARLQELEPTGIAARDLCECLLLQLTEAGYDDETVPARLLREATAELEAGKLDAAAERLGVDHDEIVEALAVLRTLDPTPAKDFRSDTADPITPELRIWYDEDKARWRVEPWRPWTRRVRPSDVMQRFKENPEAFSAAERQFLREKARGAEAFLESLRQRELTILRVTEEILEQQRDLLDHGPEAARPLTLRDIADRVDLHESTVSRVTSHKYAITPHGLLELKAFFRQSVDGVHTPDMVKARIRALTESENRAKPLSDQAICDALAREGVHAARRTVAKYRDEMGIGTRSERRNAGHGSM